MKSLLGWLLAGLVLGSLGTLLIQSKRRDAAFREAVVRSAADSVERMERKAVLDSLFRFADSLGRAERARQVEARRDEARDRVTERSLDSITSASQTALDSARATGDSLTATEGLLRAAVGRETVLRGRLARLERDTTDLRRIQRADSARIEVFEVDVRTLTDDRDQWRRIAEMPVTEGKWLLGLPRPQCVAGLSVAAGRGFGAGLGFTCGMRVGG